MNKLLSAIYSAKGKESNGFLGSLDEALDFIVGIDWRLDSKDFEMIGGDLLALSDQFLPESSKGRLLTALYGYIQAYNHRCDGRFEPSLYFTLESLETVPLGMGDAGGGLVKLLIQQGILAIAEISDCVTEVEAISLDSNMYSQTSVLQLLRLWMTCPEWNLEQWTFLSKQGRVRFKKGLEQYIGKPLAEAKDPLHIVLDKLLTHWKTVNHDWDVPVESWLRQSDPLLLYTRH